MSKAGIYKVLFVNQGQVYEVYARQVRQGDLYGFVAVAELVFGGRTEVVVDPSQEKLRDEFAGVERFHIPMHAVIRIDEVAKEGVSKIRDGDGKVTPFPGSMFPPGPRKS